MRNWARIPFIAGVAALAIPACGGGGDGGGDGSGGTAEDPKIRITSPTTASSWSVDAGFVSLGGTASIDAWNASDWAPRVRWRNAASGAEGDASESVDWVWFFGDYPTNHTWSATVPLVGGANDILLEAY